MVFTGWHHVQWQRTSQNHLHFTQCLNSHSYLLLRHIFHCFMQCFFFPLERHISWKFTGSSNATLKWVILRNYFIYTRVLSLWILMVWNYCNFFANHCRYFQAPWCDQNTLQLWNIFLLTLFGTIWILITSFGFFQQNILRVWNIAQDVTAAVRKAGWFQSELQLCDCPSFKIECVWLQPT